jgi:glycosyltransferase involved in cell wall biosynthesis
VGVEPAGTPPLVDEHPLAALHHLAGDDHRDRHRDECDQREPAELRYFHEYVEPHLREGRIEYLGEVSHGEKVELLQDARATLFPVDWEEPFGLVMIESMACGTPVIATRRGAVPEVIEHGRSGIIVDDYRDMVGVLEQADELEPLELRRAAEERFSKGRMVADYVAAFEKAIASAG